MARPAPSRFLTRSRAAELSLSICGCRCQPGAHSEAGCSSGSFEATPLLRVWRGLLPASSPLRPVRPPEERLRPGTELSLFWAGQRWAGGRPPLLSERAPGEGSLWAGPQDVAGGCGGVCEDGGGCGGAGLSLALLKSCLSLEDSRFSLKSEHRIKLANLKIISPSSYLLIICLETSAS